jgi:hypothetical protein
VWHPPGTQRQHIKNVRQAETWPIKQKRLKIADFYARHSRGSSTGTAHTGPWPLPQLLRRSFPKADIETVAQHYNTPEVCFAGQTALSLRLRQWPLSTFQ